MDHRLNTENVQRSFFEQDTLTVAKQLLGCYLVRYTHNTEIIVQLTETEAYQGEKDPASHAYRGVTPRNQVMFGEAGHLYVYLSYGVHHCVNIVTEQKEQAGAVLLRGAVPVEGIDFIRNRRPGVQDRHLMNGPGKLTQALNIGMDMYGYDLLSNDTGLRIYAPKERDFSIVQTERIGISKAKDLLWRFVINE